MNACVFIAVCPRYFPIKSERLAIWNVPLLNTPMDLYTFPKILPNSVLPTPGGPVITVCSMSSLRSLGQGRP